MFNLLSRLSPVRALALIAVSLTLQAAPAAAATYNAGDLATSTPYSISLQRFGSFSDIFNFSLSSPSEVAGGLASLDLTIGVTPYFHISSTTLDLFSATNPLTAIASGVSFLNTAGLSSGNYFVRVTGNADGVIGGQYLLGLAALPVPEPEQWMLFMAGLLAVGGIARRRIS